MNFSKVFLAILFFGPSIAWSAKITKVKANRALIQTEGSSLQKDEEYYGVDGSGKKMSILRIQTVRKDQAIAKIIKGRAAEGQTLAPYKKTAAGKHDSEMAEAPRNPWSGFGVLASYLISKMSAKFTLNSVERTAEMSGNGFGALGYYDYKMNQKFFLRGSAGIEQFQVSETKTDPVCDSGRSTTCNAIINYLSMYGLAKYNFVDGYTKAWFGGGGGYLMALSKRSTVLDSGQISANYVLSVSGGFDVNMKNGQYLPVVFEYSFFPSSSTVSANYIAVRIGWGWR